MIVDDSKSDCLYAVAEGKEPQAEQWSGQKPTTNINHLITRILGCNLDDCGTDLGKHRSVLVVRYCFEMSSLEKWILLLSSRLRARCPQRSYYGHAILEIATDESMGSLFFSKKNDNDSGCNKWLVDETFVYSELKEPDTQVIPRLDELKFAKTFLSTQQFKWVWTSRTSHARQQILIYTKKRGTLST